MFADFENAVDLLGELIGDFSFLQTIVASRVCFRLPLDGFFAHLGKPEHSLSKLGDFEDGQSEESSTEVSGTLPALCQLKITPAVSMAKYTTASVRICMGMTKKRRTRAFGATKCVRQNSKEPSRGSDHPGVQIGAFKKARKEEEQGV